MARESKPGLDALLELDGEKIVFSDKCWVKIEARIVAKTPERPHGIEYNLTYHDSSNRRVLGFDTRMPCSPGEGGSEDDALSMIIAIATPGTRARLTSLIPLSS